jgi:hypothetical protein
MGETCGVWVSGEMHTEFWVEEPDEMHTGFWVEESDEIHK